MEEIDELARKLRNESARNWRNNNKDKIRETYKRYWINKAKKKIEEDKRKRGQ